MKLLKNLLILFLVFIGVIGLLFGLGVVKMGSIPFLGSTSSSDELNEFDPMDLSLLLKPIGVVVTSVGDTEQLLPKVFSYDDTVTEFQSEIFIKQSIGEEVVIDQVATGMYELALTKNNDGTAFGSLKYTGYDVSVESDDELVKSQTEVYIESISQAMKGVTFEFVISESGQASEIITKHDNNNEDLSKSREFIDQLSSTIASMFVDLPAEDVGIGGSWVKTTSIESEGIIIKTEYVYAVEGIDDNGNIRLDGTISQNMDGDILSDGTSIVVLSPSSSHPVLFEQNLITNIPIPTAQGEQLMKQEVRSVVSVVE